MIEFNFPKVMVAEIPAGTEGTPFANVPPEIVKRVQDANYKGVVSKQGTWIINPGFELLKIDIGKYRITHNIGYKNTSISLSLMDSPGSIKTLEFHPQWFVVETLVGSVPTDIDFMFTLTMVISPPPLAPPTRLPW